MSQNWWSFFVRELNVFEQSKHKYPTDLYKTEGTFDNYIGERVPWLALKIHPLGRLGESNVLIEGFVDLVFEHWYIYCESRPVSNLNSIRFQARFKLIDNWKLIIKLVNQTSQYLFWIKVLFNTFLYSCNKTCSDKNSQDPQLYFVNLMQLFLSSVANPLIHPM